MDNLVAEILKVRIEKEVNTSIKKWGVRIKKIDLLTLPEFKVKIELKGVEQKFQIEAGEYKNEA